MTQRCWMTWLRRQISQIREWFLWVWQGFEIPQIVSLPGTCARNSVRHKRAVNDKWSRPLQTLIKMRYMSCSGLGRLPVSRPSSLWSTNAAPRWVFNNAAKRSCCAGWQCTSRDKIKGYGEAANAYFEMAWRASATSNLLVSVRPW